MLIEPILIYFENIRLRDIKTTHLIQKLELRDFLTHQVPQAISDADISISTIYIKM